MKKRKTNNKGFSLVELIIVVAIMAVLIGILAPQYLKYVEKSRVTSDNDYIDSIRKACESVCADPSITLADTTYTISIDANGVTGVTSTDGDLGQAIDAIVDIDSTTAMKSKTYQTNKVEIDIDLTTDTDGDGVADPTVAYDATNCPK